MEDAIATKDPSTLQDNGDVMCQKISSCDENAGITLLT